MKFEPVPLSKSHKSYLDQAVELSKMSDHRFKHGAIIRKSGRTISVGINYTINSPEVLSNADAKDHASIHAEEAACNAAKKVDLNGATIYVARSSKFGEPRMSKPCDRCQKILRERGIKKVYYTIDNSMDL